jgi:arabinogalactan endo-1,4-beta-galactosidase
MKRIFLYIALAAIAYVTTACSKDNTNPDAVPETPKTYDMTGFARGADVSSLTEQEYKGIKFYDVNGTETECLTLLRSLGVNAIRLRVWVNPAEYYSSKNDVIVKAWRAYNLGFRLMIDFHYSDTWADPGNQNPPAAWAGYTMAQMKQAVADHTKDVLQALKDKGIPVAWVQVGNETPSGMLYPLGQVVSSNFNGFAQFVNAGYDAVKAVYPDAKVIIHLNNGQNKNVFIWHFDGLKAAGAKWDVIGMSLYHPVDDTETNLENTWEKKANDGLETLRTCVTRYNKEVMVCEIGCNWNATWGEQFVMKVMNECKQINGCLGVFYWEPQSYGGMGGYHKGAFDDSGKPTAIMNAFAR